MISVAICTYNRATSLRRVLESLCCLHDTRTGDWELLIVDNNSSDETRQTVEQFSKRLPLRYVFEPVQGLSAARNRALREYCGDVLIFTDDDVVVDTQWLASYMSAVRLHPGAGYFGGRVIPFYPDGRPDWLRDESEQLALIDGLLVRFHLGEMTREFLPTEPTPFGASFALRRELIEKVGEFRIDLGVSGGVPGRGEEADYIDRALALGATGVYVGEAVVHHTTDPRRLRFSYLYEYGLQKGVAARRMGSRDNGSPLRAVTFLARGLLQALRGRGDRLRQCVINAGIQMALWRHPPSAHRV